MRRSLRRFLPIALILVTAHPGLAQDQSGASRPWPCSSKLFFDVPMEPLDPVQLAGLPPGSQPAVLTWRRVYQLALLRARAPEAPRHSELGPNWLVEEVQRYGLDDFARFRTDFLGSQTYLDPAADFLNLQAQLWEVESARRSLAYHERWLAVLQELVNGAASGVGLIDIDRTHASVQEIRRQYLHAVAQYRDQLDTFKVKLGLSPHAAVVVDDSSMMAFPNQFAVIDRWFLGTERNLRDLDGLVRRLPELGTVTVGGQSILDELDQHPDRLAAVLDQVNRLSDPHQSRENGRADLIELGVRSRVRHLAEAQSNSRFDLQALVLAARLLDGAVEQVIAPPPGESAARSPRAGQPLPDLLASAKQFTTARDRIVRRWTSFRAGRLALQRDLGQFPAPDWAAFLDQFTARVPDPQPESEPMDQPLPPAPPAAPVPPISPAPSPVPPRL